MTLSSSKQPIALVIGLCSHGIAMTRALVRKGVVVHAFEANRLLPGIQTNSAIIHFVQSIKSNSLVDELIKFRASIDINTPIVLFPTNDVHVKIFGERINEIKGDFLLSWHECSDKILDLLLKDNIEKRCEEVGVNYPISFVIRNLSDIKNAVASIEFPMIAKPVTPQSSFKALKCNNEAELRALTERYKHDLPILVQHWISGTDKSIYFAALYLDKGQVLTSFIGQKLESFPLAMGQTTVAITSENQDVLMITKRFFDGLQLSGPVSLEVKKDNKGRYWIIEPTVGRTDFWVQLCIAAGCDLLFLEFQHCLGKAKTENNNHKPTIWFDSEKDLSAYARYFSYKSEISQSAYQPTFSYLSSTDIKPFIKASFDASKKVVRSALKRLAFRSNKEKNNNNSLSIIIINNIENLPKEGVELLISANESIFLSFHWYKNFCKHIASSEGSVQFYCIFNRDEVLVAVLPLWLKTKSIYGINIRELCSLTSYYSPIFDISINADLVKKNEAYNAVFDYLQNTNREWDLLTLTPINGELRTLINQSAHLHGFLTDSATSTLNVYQPIIENYENYFNQLPSCTRNTVIRRTKKLDKLDSWNTTIYSKKNDVELALKQYHEIYNDSWKVKEPYPDFINGQVLLAAENNWLRLGILTIDKQPVACQFWLVANEKAYIYKLAYKNGFEKYSPGTVLNNYMFKAAIDNDKVKLIDFLTGNDAYKKDWMNFSQELYCLEVLNNKTINGRILKVKNVLSRLKA